MKANELIEYLEALPLDKVFRRGFHKPHAHRMDGELAFEPADNKTVDEMLQCVKSAIGQTYEHWKGNQYTMQVYSDVYIATGRADSGTPLCPAMLDCMMIDIASIRAQVKKWRDEEIEREPNHADPEYHDNACTVGNADDTYSYGLTKGEIDAYQRTLDLLDGEVPK